MKLATLLAGLLFATLTACSMPAITDSRHADATVATTNKLQILDHHVIPRDTEINGLKISELSGLAWDEDEQLLYAISDKGRLFHFRLVIENDLIKSVTPVYGAKLTDAKGETLNKHRRDAEGLMVWASNNGKKGDSQLIISLEGDPRIVRFTPQGRALANIPVPTPVSQVKYMRHSNTGLEAITHHPKYGFITAPEQSVKGQAIDVHTLYSLKKQWSFKAYPAKNSSITALDLIPKTNQLLIMERAWSGILNPLTISIRRLDLDKCTAGPCAAENLGAFSSSLSVDNFEGMTHIKDNRYLIVSDDGKHDLLRTLLTLFKLN